MKDVLALTWMGFLLAALASGHTFAADPAGPSSAERDTDAMLDALRQGYRYGGGNRSLDCLILPDVVADLGSEVEGVLEEVTVRRGDRVSKGQILARLEDDVESASVALSKARLARQANMKSLEAQSNFARRRLKRLQEMATGESVSIYEVDEAKTQTQEALYALEAAKEDRRLSELELSRAKASLELRTIRSPIDGIVVERFQSAGERVDVDPVLRVARIDPLRVEVVAPVGRFGSVAVGSKAIVVPEPPLSGEYEAEVTIVDKVIDAASGTFGVRLEIPNPGFALPGGLRCEIRFEQ